MTRWARGKNANKKKPLEASDWSEMNPTANRAKQPATNKADSLEFKSTKKTDPNLKKRTLKDPKDGGSASKLPKKSVASASVTSPGYSLVEELEHPSKGTVQLCNNLEARVLEEFVRKDQRREARRLKRQQHKLLARVCFNCRQPGHDLASCPRIVQDVDQGTGVCFKCGSTEHKIQQCKAKVPHGKFPFAKCFICGETGHLSRSCPDNPRGLYPNGGCCNQCGSVEHFKRDCPELQKLKAAVDTTLSTIDSRTNVDEDPSLTSTLTVTPATKKIKVVKF